MKITKFTHFLSSAFSVCYQHHKLINGYIQSPNFPRNYPNNANCSYLISSSDPPTRIILTTEQFNLESQSTCHYDSLKIYDGWSSSSPQLGPSHGYCGTNSTPPFMSTGNALFITFTSDGSETRSGFKMEYKGEMILSLLIRRIDQNKSFLCPGQYRNCFSQMLTLLGPGCPSQSWGRDIFSLQL